MRYDGIKPTRETTQTNGILTPTINDGWGRLFFRFASFDTYDDSDLKYMRQEPLWIWIRTTSASIAVTKIRMPVWLFATILVLLGIATAYPDIRRLYR